MVKTTMAVEAHISRLQCTAVLIIICCFVCQAFGYGVDPSLEVNFLEAIALKSSTATGIRQVPGYINEEPAYELEGTPFSSSFRIYLLTRLVMLETILPECFLEPLMKVLKKGC